MSWDKALWDDWIDLVIRYVQDSPFGKAHGLQGYEGSIEFFRIRREMELAVIPHLPLQWKTTSMTGKM